MFCSDAQHDYSIVDGNRVVMLSQPRAVADIIRGPANAVYSNR